MEILHPFKGDTNEIRGNVDQKVGKVVNNSQLVSYEDDNEYYENIFKFEELFQGHLKNVIRQEEEELSEGYLGRLSPFIQLKLNKRNMK